MRSVLSVLFISAVALSFATTGCGKKKDSKSEGGKGISYTAVEPPVTANTPARLLSALQLSFTNQQSGADLSLGLVDANTAINEIKNRLFSPGPTFVRQILKDIDNRMAGYDTREKEQHHSCVDGAGVSLDITTPIALNFPHTLQCIEQWNGGSGWSAFGVTKDAATGVTTTYVREGQSGGNGKVAKVDSNGNEEGWIYVAEKENLSMSQMVMHLKSVKSTGVLEFTLTGQGVGVGCGIQYRSNANYIFISGKIADGSWCATASPQELCLNASDLAATDAANCASAGLDKFELTALTTDTISYQDIYKIGSQTPVGIPAFNTAPTATTTP